MELPPIEQTGETIDITCGLLQAKLHKERFICPGINRECIEYDGQLITPKTFYVVADKGSLKDWKNAIRINGKKMRRYIDSGELDFYNHDKLCTGRCKSRIKFGLPDSITSTPPSRSPKPQTSSFRPDKKNLDLNESLTLVKDIDGFGEERDIKPNLEHLQFLHMLNLQPGANNGVNGELSSVTGDQSKGLQIVNVQTAGEFGDDDVMFWRAIVQLGLVDEFFREVKAKLDVLKANMVKNFVPSTDAKKASRIVNELGMREKLDMKLCAHKYEFDRQRDRLEKEMEALKRKVSEYEHKTEVLKQKSDCYDQLMTKKLKLDEMPSGSQDDSLSSPSSLITRGMRVDPVSPTSTVMTNGDSRSTSPYPSQDSITNVMSQDSSTDSAFVNSQDDAVTTH